MRTPKYKKLMPLFNRRRTALLIPSHFIPVCDLDGNPVIFPDGTYWKEPVFEGLEYGSDEHMLARDRYMDSVSQGGELPLEKAQAMVKAGYTLYDENGEVIEVPA